VICGQKIRNIWVIRPIKAIELAVVIRIKSGVMKEINIRMNPSM
jgi:hypothetical protein